MKVKRRGESNCLMDRIKFLKKVVLDLALIWTRFRKMEKEK